MGQTKKKHNQSHSGAQTYACPNKVQLRCNFTLAHKQFTHSLKQFTRTCIELLVACTFNCEELKKDY